MAAIVSKYSSYIPEKPRDIWESIHCSRFIYLKKVRNTLITTLI